MDALDTTGPGCNIALAEALATAETMVRLLTLVKIVRQIFEEKKYCR